MNEILLKGGEISYSDVAPWDIRFREVLDFVLPFRGAVVVPDPASEDEVNFTTIGHHKWIFLSLKSPGIKDGKRQFMTLRDMHNNPVLSDKPMIILVADDRALYEDVDLSRLDEGISEIYVPPFKDNILLSTFPKYIMIEFDPEVFNVILKLPTNNFPQTYNAGYSLIADGNTILDSGDFVDVLKKITRSGTIRTFDYSGRQNEAYSALLNLGIKKQDIEGEPYIFTNSLKIQFVDLHGNVLDKDLFPLNQYNIAAELTTWNDSFNVHGLYYLEQHNPGKINFKMVTMFKADATDDGSNVEQRYREYNHYMAIWPGYGGELTEVVSNEEETVLDLIKDVNVDPMPTLTFVRICLFHPEMYFQSEVGGLIKPETYNENVTGKKVIRYKFEDNGFHFFSAKNDVNIFNSGQQFHGDYHKTVSALKANDELYQCNWIAHPLAHLRGSMKMRAIKPNNLDQVAVRDMLEKLSANTTYFLVEPFDIVGDEDPIHFAVGLPSRINGGSMIEESVTIIASTEAGLGEASTDTPKGILRKSTCYGLKVFIGDDGNVRAHRLSAFWKSDSGIVHDTVQNSFVTAGTSLIRPGKRIQVNSFSIGSDANDPPQVQIKRTMSLNEIRSHLFLDSDTELQLLFVNFNSGGVYLIPLSPPGSDDAASDVELTSWESYEEESYQQKSLLELRHTFSAIDECCIAIIRTPASEDATFNLLFETCFAPFAISDDALRSGDIPLHPDELGGLYRSAIQKDVKVKALYWEQYLANYTGSSDLLRGLNNNESITNVINKTHEGKRGMAFRDRSTRDFGSWHQKASLIYKTDQGTDEFPHPPDGKSLTAYVGGMDLAFGRWDTEYHFTIDPERQTGQWFDIHAKIIGEAGYDVLRNFMHRWEAIDAFLGQPNLASFIPVNISDVLNSPIEDEAVDPDTSDPDIDEELSGIPDPEFTKINLPSGNSFVQITRTIPPYSCLSHEHVIDKTTINIPHEKGELGSLAAYKKAILEARRFIVINEQYFFSQEIALLLHRRLLAEDGPDFLVLVLPKLLDESHYIDPHLFQVRQLAIQTLYFGSENDINIENIHTPRCGLIIPKETTGPSVKHKVAIITPLNWDGMPVYVHSKHMIVDDVWMTIGSANMGNRSLTMDGEINASIMGKKLYRGGTDVVRNHRIEIFRLLLGLPKAYSAMVQDAYASFRLFKAIEAQEDEFSLRLHPSPLMTKNLDPNFKQKVGEDAFDNLVDIVAGLNYDDPSFAFVSCNVLDPDARDNNSTRLGMLAGLFGVGKTAPIAIVQMRFELLPALDTQIRFLLAESHNIRIYFKLMFQRESPTPHLLINVADFNLMVSEETTLLVMEENDTGQVAMPLSSTDVCGVRLEIVDSSSPPVVLSTNEKWYDPSVVEPPILPAAVLNDVMMMEVM